MTVQSDRPDSGPSGSATRVAALVAIATRLGVALDRRLLGVLEDLPEVDAPTLLRCAREGGLRARALRPRWSDLVQLAKAAVPTMLLLHDGGAAVLDGLGEDGATLLLRDPDNASDPVCVDQHRLANFWTGTIISVRSPAGDSAEDAPFDFRWLVDDVLKERALFRDIGIATVVNGALTLAPPLVFMAIIDRVLIYQSWPTLMLLAITLAIVVLHETLLGNAQRRLIAVAAGRIDARLHLFLLQRLLRLPLDFFEKNPAGEITHRAFQVNRIREFLTGQLFRTFLELSTLLILVPVLFYLNVTLTWIVIGCSVVIALIILAFLPAMRRATGKVIRAETHKSVVLIETVHGMRTVKALALEPRQAEEWNQRVATATEARLHQAAVANWPQTLAHPLERLMFSGVLVIGAYLALQDSSATTFGGLAAFAMLSGRVAGPLVSLAGLTNAYEEARSAMAEAGAVLNHPPERSAEATGVRPQLTGRITFDDVTFQYPGSLQPALSGISFDVPAGTLLGVVGRSGSGKSTVTRLLQGLNTGYTGLIKMDGIELREIEMQHLRRSLGVVLQDNFLFRGSIRDNITAGRPGITFEKVMAASRLAGAEEFIERLPRGYDTYIEEGSPNLSGGQKQRLAIARAVITDPPILILDEATSALDPESEAIVNANLLRLARGRTMVVVSHRLSSLVESDLILVLDKGGLVDCAPHETLLARCSIYRQLWLQQNRGGAATRLSHASASLTHAAQ